MDRSGPVLIVPRLAVGGLAVDLVETVVPGEDVGREIVLPTADLGGVERQLQAVRELLQPPFAASEVVVVNPPLLDQPPGHRDWNDHQSSTDQKSEAQNPLVMRQYAPPALWNGCYLPRSPGQPDLGGHRVVLHDMLRAVETRAVPAERVLAGQRDLDLQIGVKQAGVGVESIDIDHCRDQSPERLLRPVGIQEHREAADDTLAALLQLDRACQHQLSGVARRECRFALSTLLAVVEA